MNRENSKNENEQIKAENDLFFFLFPVIFIDICVESNQRKKNLQKVNVINGMMFLRF